MAEQINRAEQLWKNWEDQLAQLQRVSEVDLNDPKMLQFKYDFLTKGMFRISGDLNEKEKLHALVIGTVTDKLRQQLYPNLVQRVFHQIKARFYDKPKHLKSFEKQKEQGLIALRTQLKNAGLAAIVPKLETYLDYESPKVEIGSLNRMSDNSKLEIKVSLEKDALGRYALKEYKALLTTEGGKTVNATFSADSKVSVEEALNLLNGRAIYKSYESAEGLNVQRWVQLDFAQKEEPKLLMFAPKYEYDLKNTLLDKAVQLEHYGISKEKLRQSLQLGNLVSFNMGAKGQFYLEANPQGRTVNFYDKDKNPLSFDTLKSQVTQPAKDFKLITQQDLKQQNQFTISR